MKYGLKSVTNRRDDTLSRVGWERLEALLAEHYQRQGYQVEHVGTGGSGRRFDGGIDLKLRKDDAYILVQSKHWNAYQVTHNAVHELLGVMVNGSAATVCILVPISTWGVFYSGFFADNVQAGQQVWDTVNMLLRLDRDWKIS